jgi:hypothetical protein
VYDGAKRGGDRRVPSGHHRLRDRDGPQPLLYEAGVSAARSLDLAVLTLPKFTWEVTAEALFFEAQVKVSV